jgi:PST family polysaccharide transporter
MAHALIRLGFAFMASGLLTLGSAYVIRVIIANKLGLEATGLYQAAWTLGGLYVGMILQAMGTDFYPRLAAAAHDNSTCNRLVNEQTRASLLLAMPGILATLTLAPLVINLFYAPAFREAVGVLRWISLGIAIRVISWPLGYILVAKSQQRLFLLSDFLWTIAHLALAWILVPSVGLDGSGIAFFGAYAFHLALNYLMATKLTNFRWAYGNGRTVFLYIAAVIFFSMACLFLSGLSLTLFGLIASLGSAIYSARVLTRITGGRTIRI